MTLSLVEEIEQLHNCRTHQECAAWLLVCPLSKLMTYEMAIKARLRTRGFLIGIDYMDKLLWSMRQPRTFDGYLSPPAEGFYPLLDLIDGVARGTLVEEYQTFPPIGGEGDAL